MKYTIFSIDGEHALWRREIFESQFLSSGLTKGALMPMKGSYKGVEEYSWICLSDDFNKFVQPSGFVVNQESILRVSECNKKYTVLVELQGGNQTHLGCMKSVTEEEAKAHEAWSYRIDLDQYFITVEGNNDHPSIPSDSPFECNNDLIWRTRWKFIGIILSLMWVSLFCLPLIARWCGV